MLVVFLSEIPWAELLTDEQTCDKKLGILTDVINFGLNIIMSERSIRVHPSDRPWMNIQLKTLINRRQKAFALGNMHHFKILRNKVIVKENDVVSCIIKIKSATCIV